MAIALRIKLPEPLLLSVSHNACHRAAPRNPALWILFLIQLAHARARMISLSPSLSLSTYIHICMCVCVCVCVYAYICIERLLGADRRYSRRVRAIKRRGENKKREGILSGLLP